jgi:protease-4
MPPSYPAYGAAPMPSAPRRGNGWRVVAFLLLIGLVISLLGNLVLGIGGGPSVASSGHGNHAGDHFMEAVLEDNDSDDKILVVNIDGVISSQAVDPDGSTLVDLVHDQLDRASRDEHVKAVVLRVDSPGGEVLASDEIYRLIKKFQEGEGGKPVIATMGNVAASGGYYVSAPCRWIVANELTITGSIGVIMHGYNYRGLMDKVGVRRQVFKSGKFKDMLSPDKSPEEETAEEKAMVQGMIQETFDRFKAVVAEGRKYAAEQNKDEGRKLAADWEGLADGRILSGKTAFENGFVDELGNFDTAVDRALELTGLSKANLVAYHLPFNFANVFRIFGKAEARGVKVDLGLDLPKALQPGRLYYVAPGMVH